MSKISWIKSKFKKKSIPFHSYEECINEFLENQNVLSMKEFIQHGNTSTFEHSLSVSYYSYKIAKKLGLDYRSAARGAFLHDFFLYDWHFDSPKDRWHGYHHPKIALENAEKYFSLNGKEKDIIKKHMWPLTISFPRYRESVIVLLVDKYCSIMEYASLEHKEAKRLCLEMEIN